MPKARKLNIRKPKNVVSGTASDVQSDQNSEILAQTPGTDTVIPAQFAENNENRDVSEPIQPENTPSDTSGDTPNTMQTFASEPDMPAPSAPKRATGSEHRAATRPQLYGADKQSDRDIAYLRFFGSFLANKPSDTSVITYSEIAQRQLGCQMRNPLPGAGGKSGALDRGILSRFDKFGYTVNVASPDNNTRLGFRFTNLGANLAAVQAGKRDTYSDAGYLVSTT